MKTGYDQFFQNARKAADKKPATQFSTVSSAKPKARINLDLSEDELEAQIRRRMKMSAQPQKKQRRRRGIPWKLVSTSFLGLVVAYLGFENHEQVENIIKRVEFQVTGQAYAEEKPKKPAAPEKPAAATSAKPEEAADEAAAKTAMTGADLDHLQKLNDRKKELDAREEELNRVEIELQTQRMELDKRLKELEEMRGKISSMLENRVKIDEEKVDTLVQMYTNMKAPQAAKVFETMDEDLAIEILGRMKKKNAADIMNLLKPDKAQVLSEMFAGFKRRAPASTP